jgi:cell division protein FtsB
LVKSPDVNLTLAQRQDELADYVNTTATAFLGMTVGCARCHNHKFDPILQRDYYAMAAVFAGVEHGERQLPGAETQKQKIASLESKSKSLEREIDELRANAPARTAEGKRDPVSFKLNIESFEPTLAKWLRFTISDASGGEPCIDELEIFDVAGRNVALSDAGAVPSASGTLPGYKIHQLAHINDGKYGNEHSWISNTVGGGWVQIELAAATKIAKVQWGRDRNGAVKDRLATHYTIEVATAPNVWKKVASQEGRKPFGKTESRLAFISRLPEAERKQAQDLVDASKQIREEINKLTREIPKAYLGTFKAAEPVYRLYRGDPTSPRELAAPDALSVVSSLGLSGETPESERRLALARWIASPDNPLTARVIVNRVWHYHFGTGIVSTPSDLGKNGTPPTHPKLLDWLAWNFMQNDWSLKWLHRQILNSATFQQSSAPREEGLAKDAASRLLWRYPPRRLEAEAIRDCVLQATGSLQHRGGGPGFLLLDIDHENVHHYFPKKEIGPSEFRRMIYMTKIRQEQDAVFGVFDCPDGGQVIPSRSRSTTPLQALNLLNSDFMLQQAQRLADRVTTLHKGNRTSQVKELFRVAYTREPAPTELRAAKQLANVHGLHAVCRAILNSNEFLFLQ